MLRRALRGAAMLRAMRLPAAFAGTRLQPIDTRRQTPPVDSLRLPTPPCFAGARRACEARRRRAARRARAARAARYERRVARALSTRPGDARRAAAVASAAAAVTLTRLMMPPFSRRHFSLFFDCCHFAIMMPPRHHCRRCRLLMPIRLTHCVRRHDAPRCARRDARRASTRRAFCAPLRIYQRAMPARRTPTHACMPAR